MTVTILKPFIKRTWWKWQELKYINPMIPENFNNYYEPFVWWWAVYFSIKADNYYINDKSKDLIDLYKTIKSKKDRKKW